MFYVFDVANGIMITLDVKLAFESVPKLNEEIEKKCGIRAAHQVLLISGGERLEPDAQISSYSTGMDSNPVYLYDKSISGTSPSSCLVSTKEYEDTSHSLENQVCDSSIMPTNYKTLVARTQIAQEFRMLAHQQSKVCEDLVKEQHFQQQGWAAIVAHLDDVVNNCRSNAESLEKNFESYLTDHQQYRDILENFDEDVKVLEKILILSVLRQKFEDSSSSLLEDSINSNDQNVEELTLLNWISTQRLKQLTDQCSRGLKQFDKYTIESLKEEISEAMEAADEQNLKEIKRVCERLFSLEQLMSQMKQLLEDQTNHAQKFLQDHNYASTIKDAELTADICSSHQGRLISMIENNNQLREILQRCIKAKEKISVSIQRRLQRIVEVEKWIVQINGKIIMYKDSLDLLCKDLKTLKQVHLAPEMYVSAVIEVVRRRNFSEAFHKWSNDLVNKMQSLHSEELDKRREFQNKFEGHFLNELFSGLEDIPSAFATERPQIFDDALPNVTMEDLKSLQKQLPNSKFDFSLPNLNTEAVSFFSKNMTQSGIKDDGCKLANSFTTEQKKLIPSIDEKDLHSNNDYNISKMIQSFDESFKIRLLELRQEKQVLQTAMEFELLDYKNVLQAQEEKIKSLKSLIVEKESQSKTDHLLLTMKQKFSFEQESQKKLELIYKDIEIRQKFAKSYKEKLLDTIKSLKMLEHLFKESLDKCEKKSKELYD